MSRQPSYFETVEEKAHGLLEPPSIAYSNVTVRRAFVVWMYCGQTNKFKDVCNYFHYLEALEGTLSEKKRASSRQHEFDLFTAQPPTSAYLIRNFPKLYPAMQTQDIPHNEPTRRAPKPQVIEKDRKTEGNGTSRADILKVSVMIRDYCKSNTKTLAKFLNEFKQHTSRCGLTNTLENVTLYIKRKIIESEIHLEVNYAITSELLRKHYDVNGGNRNGHNISTKHQNQSKCDLREPVIAKDSNTLYAFNTVALTKNNSIANQNKVANNSKAGKDLVSKFDNMIECKTTTNSNTISSDFFDTYNNKHESKLNTTFSESDFIIKDLTKLRNI